MPRRPARGDATRRSSRTRRLLAAATAAVALAGVVAACGEQEEEAGPDDLSPVRILRPDPEAADDTQTQRRDGLPVVEGTDRLEGLIVNPFDLEAGQCFNNYLTALGDNTFQELTTVVDCSGPHDGEVYFQVFHPAEAGEPYPGPDEMPAWAQQHCYAQFEGFVGQEYELSELDIGILHPTELTWSDPIGRHREVTCYVEAWRGGRLLGSMRGSGF
ncbi:MAG: septum formation family protein [bacterium]|nr:septum formation family protein [bacterium]MCY4103031.1 septum formation family protein [bacterium]